jgi:hypothetical protein
LTGDRIGRALRDHADRCLGPRKCRLEFEHARKARAIREDGAHRIGREQAVGHVSCAGQC